MAWYLLIAAVVSAMVSRTAVAVAGVPALVNFLHYPLLAGAFALARRRNPTPSIRSMERLLVISGVLTAASWLGGTDSTLLRTLLVWPVLMEPFVVIVTIWHLASQGIPAIRAQHLAVAIVLAELPLALGQAVVHGLGDGVQGTLIAQGAGHHVLGLIGLAVALVGLSDVVTGEAGIRSWSGVMLVTGFTLGVLTDVKQGLALFLLVSALITMTALRRRSVISARLLVAAGAVAALIGIAVALNTFALLEREPWRATAFAEAKTASVVGAVGLMAENPLTYLVGLGPGTTFTRVAWLTSPLGADSFLSRFGLQSTPVTERVAAEWATNPLWLASSTSSPFSTWTGVFGDLGILGVLVYGVLWWVPARAASKSVHRGIAVGSVVVFSVGLGLLFNWLEEPQYVLIVGLLVGARTAPAPTGRLRVARAGGVGR